MAKTQHFWVFILSPGTSTRGATRDLDSQRRGPRLAAPLIWVKVPWRRESRSLAPRVEVPCAASRGPLWRRESRSLGTKWKPKNVEFWAFIDPSGQNQLFTAPLLSKIWDLNDRKKLWTIPLNKSFKNLEIKKHMQPVWLLHVWPFSDVDFTFNSKNLLKSLKHSF